jgi:hypothetical protein
MISQSFANPVLSVCSPLLIILIASLLSITCGGSTSSITSDPTPVILDLRAVLGSTDLAKGQNRLVFVLMDHRSAPIMASSALVNLSYVHEGKVEHYAEIEAPFRTWPTKSMGVFAIQINFPLAGRWLAEIVPQDGNAAGQLARLSLDIKELSVTPAIGAPAPRSKQRTLNNVKVLEELTTDPKPDPKLYDMTVAQALDVGLPFLITFSTPAFCSSAICGPQLDVVKDLYNAYEGQINAIHIEVFENPLEVRGNPRRGRINPAMREWALPTEPWTFIIDSEGKISAKFEAFTSYEELEEALIPVVEVWKGFPKPDGFQNAPKT